MLYLARIYETRMSNTSNCVILIQGDSGKPGPDGALGDPGKQVGLFFSCSSLAIQFVRV